MINFFTFRKTRPVIEKYDGAIMAVVPCRHRGTLLPLRKRTLFNGGSWPYHYADEMYRLEAVDTAAWYSVECTRLYSRRHDAVL